MDAFSQLARLVEATSAEALASGFERFVVHDKLCAQCIKILSPIETLEETSGGYTVCPHHQAHETMKAAALSGCPICTAVYRSVRNNDRSSDFSEDSTRDDHYTIEITWGRPKTPLMFWIIQKNWRSKPSTWCFELYPLRDRTLQSLQLATSYSYPESTGNGATAQLVHSWLNGCLASHRECPYVVSDYHPPRLLDVSGDCPYLRTTFPAAEETRLRYATLSHCWGISPDFLTLTASNLDQFLEGIALQSLPRNFQDAVLLCQRLQLKYLWIDSLCIIQSGPGSNEDWSRHVSEMGRIYRNCTINIAASRARNSDQGIYAQRNPTHIRPTIINYAKNRGPSTALCLLRQHWTFMREAETWPLSRRGWVFQECILAPRVIHFGNDQIYWECYGSSGVSESFPAGFNTDIYPIRKNFELPAKVCDPELLSVQFRKMIVEYVGLQLTYPHIDKFSAFAAIAEHFCRLRDDEYIAGFHRSSLPEALLWYVADPKLAISTGTCYRCPSWSWAKADSEIIFPSWEPDRWASNTSSLAKLEHVEVTLVDPSSPYGRLKGALLVLRAPLVQFRWPLNGFEPILWGRSYEFADILGVPRESLHVYMYFDSVADYEIDQEDAFFLPMLCPQSDHTAGLILRRIRVGTTEKFERIGIILLKHDASLEKLQDQHQKMVELV